MQAVDFETCIKIVVVGNGNVGKSTLIRRFCTNEFVANYKKTIGADYQEREILVQAPPLAGSEGPGEMRPVRLMLWDCAGQEEFDKITQDYYRDANAVILAFATTDRASFEMVKGWRAKLESVLSVHQIPAALIQTKADLVGEPNAVDPKEAEALARELKIRFYRISTKDNVNVENVFTYLAETHLKQVKAIKFKDTKESPDRKDLFVAKKEGGAEPASQDKMPSATHPVTQRTGGKKEKCVIS